MLAVFRLECLTLSIWEFADKSVNNTSSPSITDVIFEVKPTTSGAAAAVVAEAQTDHDEQQLVPEQAFTL